MSTEVLSQAIDPASDRAVYKQIADHLRHAPVSVILARRLPQSDGQPGPARSARP
jgi:hypothetical protein